MGDSEGIIIIADGPQAPETVPHEDYLFIYDFLHTVDPTVAGFRVTHADVTTTRWHADLFYADGKVGEISGEGLQVTNFRGGSSYDLSDVRAAAEELKRDPLTTWMEEARE